MSACCTACETNGSSCGTKPSGRTVTVARRNPASTRTIGPRTAAESAQDDGAMTRKVVGGTMVAAGLAGFGYWLYRRQQVAASSATAAVVLAR